MFKKGGFMKALYIICFSIIALGLLVSFIPSSFKEVGYFKDVFSNRIFIYSYNPARTEKEVLDFAKDLMFKENQLTIGYFYPEGSENPGDRVTMAKNMVSAQAICKEYIKYDYVSTLFSNKTHFKKNK